MTMTTGTDADLSASNLLSLHNFSTALDAMNSTLIMPSNTVDSCGRQQPTRFTTTDESQAVWITRVSFPILLAIGTVGNILGIILVPREHRQTDGQRRRGSRSGTADASRSRRIFLLGMFVTDVCYLWNRMIILLGVDVWEIEPETKKAYGHFFEWTHGVWSFLDALLSFSSQGILVVFCIDRYHALTSPLQHKTSSSFRRTTSLVVVGLIYSSTALCSLINPVMYYWVFNHMKIQSQASLPQYPPGLRQWRIFDAWFEVIIRLSATIIIVVLNWLILVRLKSSRETMGLSVQNSIMYKGNSKASSNSTLSRKPTRGPSANGVGRTNTMKKSTHATSSSAFTILLYSSIFYLLTNMLEIVLSFWTVLSIYPVCLLQTSTEQLITYEPARDLSKHLYFAFAFLSYVCVKLDIKEYCRRKFSKSRRRLSSNSEPRTSLL
ncbi:hypothetical protein RvY_17372 [Ramazzottius varieornatus]|uniref:G-protein coupled receptors family 1 profile domain-containing protein n=1 Tax=Ramazzottius varieornatus TaxID=947166 RepID=A0A1D1W5T2_RAMVA|nr:hypothetical protein RvY_17372 [Ramazzottius varieornatus]